MKNIKSTIAHLLLIPLLIIGPTKVWALDDDAEEVSYDQLLKELTLKNRPQKIERDPLENIDIHAGFAMVSSLLQIKPQDQNFYRFHNGMQLSVGIDLLSPRWTAEGAFRNFGIQNKGTETLSVREFDLKLFNRGQGAFWGHRLGGGLGTRYVKYEDSALNIIRNDTTPVSIFFAGVDAHISKEVSLGCELGTRISLLNDTVDRQAMDLTLRLDAYF